MGEMFFTADTHFGHRNIIAYANRPFASVEEMDEVLIERWNERIRPHDVVYHLGDFSLTRGPRTAETLGFDRAPARFGHGLNPLVPGIEGLRRAWREPSRTSDRLDGRCPSWRAAGRWRPHRTEDFA